jgi:Ca-activated chloride channel homolog
MNWGRTFEFTDYLYIGLFLLIYLIYFVRVRGVSTKLNINTNSTLIKFLIRFSYMGLLGLALLGPTFGKTDTEAMAGSKDIFLAVDLSNSMNANDIEPSRLDKIKNELVGLIENFELNRIGIIIFNSVADIYAPLTFDTDRLKLLFSNLKTNLLQNGSTDFNSVLSLLLEKMRVGNTNQIALIITDGESHAEIDENLIKKIKAQKINVVFLGVGTTKGGNIPVLNSFKKDEHGQNILTKLDINILSKLANQLGGAYFVINENQNQINLLIDYIKNLKVEINESQTGVTYNKFIYFLIPAFILIAIDFLTTVRIFKL